MERQTQDYKKEESFWIPERRNIYQTKRRELRERLRPYFKAVKEVRLLTSDDYKTRINY